MMDYRGCFLASKGVPSIAIASRVKEAEDKIGKLTPEQERLLAEAIALNLQRAMGGAMPKRFGKPQPGAILRRPSSLR